MSGWMADMMFEYVRYSGDMDFLRRFGFDFMCGVMRVYEAMLEFDGEHYALPWLTSPEYRGAEINACGKNPSFHLAAIHRLLRDIFAAAEMLGEKVPQTWYDIRKKLPVYTEVDGEIGLWEGLKLDMSHRHHSHLAAICPFDMADELPEEVQQKSLRSWISHGMGEWAGWSFPWAVMLHTRFGNPEMAQFLLQMWPLVYTNKGAGLCTMPISRGSPTVFAATTGSCKWMPDWASLRRSSIVFFMNAMAYWNFSAVSLRKVTVIVPISLSRAGCVFPAAGKVSPLPPSERQISRSASPPESGLMKKTVGIRAATFSRAH